MRTSGDRLWIGIPGPVIDDADWAHLEAVAPGGIILFRRNIVDAPQIRDLIGALRGRLGAGLHVVVDQEGGAVVRFERECTVFPGNLALGAVASADRERGLALAREQGRISGAELRELGIDGNLAPVCDLLVRADNPGVGVRSLGSDPERVGSLAAELVRGHLESGVFPVLKHFPGLGAADRDSHHELPRIPAGHLARDLEPFGRAIAAGAPVVMTAHLICEEIDPDHPVTNSPHVVSDLLRGRLDFSGAVMTDDLEMGAVAGISIEEKVEGAVAAGHDIVCVCHERELQLRARARLEALGAGDDSDVSARLTALYRDPHGTPAVGSGEEIARQIAEAALTVLRRGDAPIEIPAGERWLLVLPTLRRQSPAEDPLRAEDLRPLGDRLSDRTTLLEVGAEPSGEEIARAAAMSADLDGIIVAAIGLRTNGALRQLVLGALEWNPRTTVVLLGDPGELSALPTRDFTVVTAYGSRRVHQAALAALLLGERNAPGVHPARII